MLGMAVAVGVSMRGCTWVAVGVEGLTVTVGSKVDSPESKITNGSTTQ